MFRIVSGTNRGKVRAENQDCVLSEQVSLAGCDAFLCVVADGMGGHLAGDVASRMAAEELSRSIRAGCLNLHAAKVLEQGFAHANAAVYSAAERHAEYAGMGTTLTAALLLPEQIYICHAGDSRAYMFSGGSLTRLTHDHSVVEELLRHGSISSRDARYHPQRHVLTRALGVSPELRTDCQHVDWQTGEMLLLCTDGLTGVLSDREIEGILREDNDWAAVIRRLIDEALSRGAPDNVTILLAMREDSV
ncbi:MAG: Serine/threonine phosphatase stp [Firmicutes bacterium]|nr:Serine/threonine phosphatase stp [Bacillota bacterium]